MSVMTPSKSSKGKKKALRQAAPVNQTIREAEAPDRGALSGLREAPESRRTRSAEAPDAGSGRSQTFDNDFTNGRSQS